MDDDLFDEPAGSDRFEERLRSLGTRNPRCSHPDCAETDPFARTGVDPRILCAEHRADAAGRPWIDGHHNAGRANTPADVSKIPGNDHSAVTHRYQAEWPRGTLRNPDGSPLLRAAAAVRGWLDVLRLIIDRTVGWVPELLERLDAWLRERIGSRWWDDFLDWLRAQ